MNVSDPQLLQHIAALQSNQHFIALREHMRTCLTALHQELVFAHLDEIPIGQGRAQELTEFLATCDEAHEHLKAIQRQKEISAGTPDVGSGNR